MTRRLNRMPMNATKEVFPIDMLKVRIQATIK